MNTSRLIDTCDQRSYKGRKTSDTEATLECVVFQIAAKSGLSQPNSMAGQTECLYVTLNLFVLKVRHEVTFLEEFYGSTKKLKGWKTIKHQHLDVYNDSSQENGMCPIGHRLRKRANVLYVDKQTNLEVRSGPPK